MFAIRLTLSTRWQLVFDVDGVNLNLYFLSMSTNSNRNPTSSTHLSLREACLTEALDAIREKGVEALSLRDVARRLKVSHQAPYKHFSSKDHLLAEVISRCLRDFADHLKRSGHGDEAVPLSAEDAMAHCLTAWRFAP